ncbi:MAG: AsmA family protein, partial [Planctomycetota bacterium]
MGKLKKLVVILLLLVVIVAAAGHFFSGSILKAAVEKGGSEGLGTEVRVESASLWAPSSTASLRGLEIANLDGFTQPNLLDAAGIDVEVSATSLLGEPVTIGTITLTEPVFTLEATLTSTNLTKLLAQLDKGEAKGEPAPEADTSGSGEKPTELKIELVRIVGFSPEPLVSAPVGQWGPCAPVHLALDDHSVLVRKRRQLVDGDVDRSR